MILTGHWLYRSPDLFNTLKDMYDYQSKINISFSAWKFPDVTGLVGGKAVMRWQTPKYNAVRDG